MSTRNLELMLLRADRVDRAEGLTAYLKYHAVMQSLAQRYAYPVEIVVAVFSSLSPNSDYISNLRSTASVLDGLNKGIDPNMITVATYKHCRTRAVAYARGESWFTKATKGLKILSFYHNLVDPLDPKWVTIDGHMVGAYQNSRGTMKELLVKPKEYKEIAECVTALADRKGMLPNQMQATVWFARKRWLGIKVPAPDLFGAHDDVWKTVVHVDQIIPYPVLPQGEFKIFRDPITQENLL